MRMTDFKNILEGKLAHEISSISAMSGGDINQVFKLNSTEKNYVVKVNNANDFPAMFSKEALGLQLLGTAVKTPDVIEVFQEQGFQYLILEYIESETATDQFWLKFGESLAKLHRVTDEEFGLDHDNYIGSLIQINDSMTSWQDFFIEKRMEPLIRMGLDSGILDRSHMFRFNQLYKALPSLIPNSQNSLLHGDLWSGNLMCGTNQEPVLIDPAVYYGHREVDIAMTKMFGGFNEVYLEAYQEIFPLENGWASRLEIYNLYPRLVHLNLFGTSYLSGINTVLNRYT